MSHAGLPLYNRYLARLRAKQDIAATYQGPADRDFIATCYEVFLGRELETQTVSRDRLHWPTQRVLRSVVESPEFASDVLSALRNDQPFPPGRFVGAPTMRQKFWAADRLNVSAPTAARLQATTTWRDLLQLLLGDVHFVQAAGLEPLDTSSMSEDAVEANA